MGGRGTVIYSVGPCGHRVRFLPGFWLLSPGGWSHCVYVWLVLKPFSPLVTLRSVPRLGELIFWLLQRWTGRTVQNFQSYYVLNVQEIDQNDDRELISSFLCYQCGDRSLCAVNNTERVFIRAPFWFPACVFLCFVAMPSVHGSLRRP